MNYGEILDTICPSKEDQEKIEQTKQTIITELEGAANKAAVEVVVQAGGSTAKGTYLKGDFDIDIFVRFKSREKNLSDQLELFLADISNKHHIVVERIHGSRDYFTFSYNKLFFEIVPVKYVETVEEVENVTDMSPLHVQWISEHLTPQLQNDIRLAKQFCKAALVYGAESFINGVSGHVLDILLVQYSSFDKWIQAVSEWNGVTVIDPQQQHENVFKTLNQSKLMSPLIVIDPVDSQRNAAAALSQDKYEKLIEAAKKFLKQPSKEFFTIPSFNVKKLQEQLQEKEALFVLEVEPVEGKKDIVATKILKVFEFLHRHLQLYEFTVREADWFYQEKKSYLYYFVNTTVLERIQLRTGPPLHLESDVKKFKEVHEQAFVKDNKLYAPLEREFIDAYDCFNHLVASEFVQSRASATSVKKYNKK